MLPKWLISQGTESKQKRQKIYQSSSLEKVIFLAAAVNCCTFYRAIKRRAVAEKKI
jgi:hypothetical protein